MVAMVDRSDAYHRQCTAALATIPPDGFVTTWACLTEAMYLLGRRLGITGQDHLWDLLADEVVTLHVPGASDWKRIRALMSRYADAPMDLADASLVAAAEDRGLHRIFTFDRHFRAYRFGDGQAFVLLP